MEDSVEKLEVSVKELEVAVEELESVQEEVVVVAMFEKTNVPIVFPHARHSRDVGLEKVCMESSKEVEAFPNVVCIAKGGSSSYSFSEENQSFL